MQRRSEEKALESAELSRPRGVLIYLALEAGWPSAIAFGMVGAAVLWAAGLAWPSGYRAEAAVLVHHNVERVIKDPSSDEAASYIDRQTAVLEALAYSDSVWEDVAQQMVERGWIESAAQVEGLKEQVRLPHPKDGEWRFAATTRNPALSAHLAQAWADAFVARTNQSVRAAVRLETLAERIREETGALVQAERECADLGAASAVLETVLAELRAAEPAQDARPVEGALLVRLAERAGLDISGVAAETVADQTALAERLLRALAASRASCLARAEQLEALLESHRAEAEALSADELALSPLLEVYPMRRAEEPKAPLARPGAALGIGAVVGLCAWVLRMTMFRDAAGGRPD